MITTPIRFFHKNAGFRVEAVETPEFLCGDGEDACKCALFFTDCHYVCHDVCGHTGSFVYFKKVEK